MRDVELFSRGRIGTLEVANRFVRSATFEGMAGENGAVTQPLLTLYRDLADGGPGVITTGHMYVHPSGIGHPRQIGIHEDAAVSGLRKLTSVVHEYDGKIFFQLSHAGRQTSERYIGRMPLAPSSMWLDPVYFERAAEISVEEIETVIVSFAEAARRAVAAGADGIQILAAHGYLLSEFLSPFFNKRSDEWGGTPEKRFRMLGEVIRAVQAVVPEGFPITVKLNGRDHTPFKGVTPDMAAEYARRLEELGIDAIEVSAGTIAYSVLASIRGRAPANELAATLPEWMRPFGWLGLKGMARIWPLSEGYNLEAAELVKAAAPNTPIILVGGLSTLSFMRKLLREGRVDYLALARPFVANPDILKSVRAGTVESVGCIYCNRCFAAIGTDLPLRCYRSGLPSVTTGISE